ncbi:MAG TPA: nuclear transport factor 2 family protein [Myxococcales bacterium]|nr:nuclear transport factor 2 family protein [Myxococcales bacterium]
MTALVLAATLASSPAVEIGRVLDDLHAAAAAADEARYFAHFAPDAVFLGTDPGERWTIEAFRAYAHPRFAAGKGWTYVPRPGRHVAVDGEVAWFDEVLDNAKYGACRGTGVLRRVGGAWRVAQYSLTFLVPNRLAERVTALVKSAP